MIIHEMIQESEINTLIAMGNCIEKEFYMEAVQGLESANIPDATSKWTRFKNWIARAINQIFSMLHSARFKKALDKCENLNTSVKKHSISKYHKYMFQKLMNVRRVGTYKESIQSFVKGHIKTYKQAARNFQGQLNAFKNKQIEGIIEITGEQLTKIVEWIKNDGKDMATELPNVNKYLKEIDRNLNEEDRKSDEFKQYIQMITIKVQVDLNLVKEMIKFLGDLAKNAPKDSFNKTKEPTESTTTTTTQTSGESDTSSSSESDDNSKWTTVTVPGPVKALCDKFVFKKHPECSEIRIKQMPSGKYSVDYGSHHHEFDLDKELRKPTGIIIKKAISQDKIEAAKNGGIIIKK